MTPILGIMASQISGHLWAPEGAYDALATVTLASNTATITFAGIPSGYKHLQLRVIGRATGSAIPTVVPSFNGDTGANYYNHFMYGDGASVSAGSSSAANAGVLAKNTLGANIFGTLIMDILDYSSVNKNKTVRTLSGFDGNGEGWVMLRSSLWMNSSSAITTITLTESGAASFMPYSSFALYGVK